MRRKAAVTGQILLGALSLTNVPFEFLTGTNSSIPPLRDADEPLLTRAGGNDRYAACSPFIEEINTNARHAHGLIAVG